MWELPRRKRKSGRQNEVFLSFWLSGLILDIDAAYGEGRTLDIMNIDHKIIGEQIILHDIGNLIVCGEKLTDSQP